MASTLVNCSIVVVSPVNPSSTGSMFPQMALCHGGRSSSAKPSFLLMYGPCGVGDCDGSAAAVGEDVADGFGDGEGEGDATSPGGLSTSREDDGEPDERDRERDGCAAHTSTLQLADRPHAKRNNIAANAYKKLGVHGAAAAVHAQRYAHFLCGSRVDLGPIRERPNAGRSV